MAGDDAEMSKFWRAHGYLSLFANKEAGGLSPQKRKFLWGNF
ncbi:Protein of unknown function [Lactobacillus equicursoris 66c]|uniref:Uncharacterized protein n=1 Tax=Lactobacillus equicursoris 66c TaxID=872326 RepID=K0NRJ7_9LACO|nr:Protein of unknown function [Lactobacillus equicursoris 66c]